jgi:hypothetical protein
MTAIAIGMVACSNDDVPPTPESLKGSTYASIAVTLPKAPSTRALPDDYNNLPDWEGIDAIKTITVFLVNETLGTIDHSTFGTDQFDAIDTDGVLKPNLAVKGILGEAVKAYVVLNGDSDVLTALKAATLSTFNTVYETAVEKNASDLAFNDGTNDVIMMTNTVLPTAITIEANVDEATAKAGTKNSVKVEVERVVSRALATVAAAAKTAPINVKDAMDNNVSTITIQSVNYVVGQSNKEFFLTKRTDWKTPDAVYDHVPSATVTWDTTLFDNTGLTSLTEVKTATGATSITQFETALKGEGTASKFVLPVTHADADYRKGNTTYFEVTAIFTPDAVDGGAYTAGTDVFLGMNDGKFYSTRALAEASGQKATHYKGDGDTGAIMKYVLWLNPDKVPGAAAGEKATMSPTVRNQVYHAHITGFKQIGLPNNPLNPTDPNNPDPDNPTDPTIPGNFNPINPIKPTDPLQTEDTYLSVQITVLPWGIHSYEINLGNDY